MVMPDIDGTLHVVHNGSVAGTLKVALRLRLHEVLESEDPLDCGPAPATDVLDEWRAARENFLHTMYVGWPDFTFTEYSDTGLFMNINRLLGAERVIIWAGMGLPEQLLIAWVFRLFDLSGGDVSRISIIQFEQVQNGRLVRGIGELHPEDIRAYCPAPHMPTYAEGVEIRRIWRTYTSPESAQLLTYTSESSPLPIAQQAMRQLIYRYPDRRTGLSNWDQHLLQCATQHGPKAARVIGYTMANGWGLDHPGDFYLFQRLTHLGTLKAPLLTISGDTADMRGCEVRITPLGERVLAGEINNVAQNGIDDWIGGVHLTNRTPVIFRDGDSLVLS